MSPNEENHAAPRERRGTPVTPGARETRETREDGEPRPDEDLALRSRALVERIRAGDGAAWEELVTRFESLVLGVPRRLGLGEPDCEEVFQSTWALLHQRVHDLRRPTALPAWLAATARHHALRLLRDAHREVDERDLRPEPGPGPAQSAAEEERRHLVRLAVENLSPPCRRLLERLYFEPEPGGYQEVARSLGMPIGSVGPTRRRCLARLGELLRQLGLDEPGGEES